MLLPVPGDETSYYICIFGQGVKTQCSRQKVFDPKLRMCVNRRT